ncbi:MAG: hypothetical protein J6Q38_03470 [Clostridia bacterium]|nr:hypothetical protein [Clostridia bacterium]
MKIKSLSSLLLTLISVIFLFSIGGVLATWNYALPVEDAESNVGITGLLHKTVYITNAKTLEGDGNLVIDGYLATNLDTKVTLKNQRTSYVTASVTVYNSTNVTYAFNAVKYQSGNYDNTNITYNQSIKHGDQILAYESLTFTVKYAFAGSSTSNRVLNSILNFEFVQLSELPEEEEIAVSGALQQFQNIINDVDETGSFTKLLNQMDNNQANDRHDDSYIGNVNGASSSDIALLEDLFQGNLTLIIDGVETEVTILIKRENVDGNTTTGDENGNELTIYMTTSALTKQWYETSKTATVYAAVYSSNDDGDNWYRLGEMYEGKATIKGYDGNIFGSGSFDTDSWVSTNNKTIETIISNL